MARTDIRDKRLFAGGYKEKPFEMTDNETHMFMKDLSVWAEDKGTAWIGQVWKKGNAFFNFKIEVNTDPSHNPPRETVVTQMEWDLLSYICDYYGMKYQVETHPGNAVLLVRGCRESDLT